MEQREGGRQEGKGLVGREEEAKREGRQGMKEGESNGGERRKER